MLLSCLLLIPILGIFSISSNISYEDSEDKLRSYKITAFVTSIVNLILSLVIFILFDFSSNQFQFVQEHYDMNLFDVYLGVDGISIYFVLLTTIIMPIAILSNWNSIIENVKSYLIIMLLLETLLLAVFLVLDILLFYIFFESILPPLFLLIGLFGSNNKVRASFYLFLYTLLGSLFLLLSILTMSSIMGTTDFDALFKTNFDYTTQIFLFIGIFIAFAVKTPTIFLNSWLLKAHVESPLGGSIVLAGIVLKLSLYGIFRLILPILPKASLDYTFIVFVIGVITIIYASFSTLRTIDIKELIAYSSVSHAAVYLIGVFSNTIQGIEGGIVLGLAHGFVSSGLFICAGGILYDRSGTRLIHYYKGITQMMPLFSILFFNLCLGNCGAPLTLNFVGEFMSLYGVFERLPVLGVLASTSIVFSAAYTIYMFNRISFGGLFTKFFEENISDLTKREFFLLFVLVFFTVVLGIYPSLILDGLHYNVSSLIYKIGGLPYETSSYISNGVVPKGIRLYSTKTKHKQYNSANIDLNANLLEKNHMNKNWTKHFTILNLTVVFISLLLGVLFKFIILPYILAHFSIDLSDMAKYIISGSFVAIVRLGIKGIFEEIFREHFPLFMGMNTGDPNPSFPGSSQGGPQIMAMNTGNQPSSPQSGQSGQPVAGPSQAGPSQSPNPSQAGPSQSPNPSQAGPSQSPNPSQSGQSGQPVAGPSQAGPSQSRYPSHLPSNYEEICRAHGVPLGASTASPSYIDFLWSHRGNILYDLEKLEWERSTGYIPWQFGNNREAARRDLMRRTNEKVRELIEIESWFDR